MDISDHASADTTSGRAAGRSWRTLGAWLGAAVLSLSLVGAAANTATAANRAAGSEKTFAQLLSDHAGHDPGRHPEELEQTIEDLADLGAAWAHFWSPDDWCDHSSTDDEDDVFDFFHLFGHR